MKYKKKGNILELGAGGGYFLREAENYGFKVFAIELNKIKKSYICNYLKYPLRKRAIKQKLVRRETI